MVRIFFALIFALMLAPQALWAEALPKDVPAVGCESLFDELGLESPGVVLQRALANARNHLINGGFEANFRQFFKPMPRVLRLWQKNYDQELEVLKQEKLILLDVYESKLSEKLAESELDEKWILKFLEAYMGIVDFNIGGGINVQVEGDRKYFYEWKDIEDIFELTRSEHKRALTELENEDIKSFDIKEMIDLNKSFRTQPHIGSLSKRDIVMGVLNKVNYVELTLRARYADGFYLAPRAFINHDLAHCSRVIDYFEASSYSEMFENFRLTFLKGYQNTENDDPVLDNWAIEYLFFALHEVPYEFIVTFDSGTKLAIGAQAASRRKFNEYLKRSDMEQIMEEEFDLVLGHIFKILERGGH